MLKKDNEVKRETGLNCFILVSLIVILQTLGSVIGNSSTVVDYKFAVITSSKCDNQTIAGYKSWTDAVVENFSRSANFSYEIHGFCDGPSLLNQLLSTFEDPSISSVISITDFPSFTYMMHIVQQSNKLIIAANQPFKDKQNLQNVFSMYPGFDQMSLNLERALRHFQWQNVTLFRSSDPYWWTFNSVIYMTLTKFGYNVVNGEMLPSSNSEAIISQWWTTNVESEQVSVIVLCMSVTDQVRILRIQRNSSHVIFTFNTSPFSTTHSLMELQGATLHDVNLNDTSSPSILENVFIVSALPPKLICNTNFGICSKGDNANETKSTQNEFEVYEIYDSIALLSYAIENAKQANENILDSRIIKGHLRNITIDGYGSEIRLNPEGERLYDFILLDYHPDSKEFRSALTISRSTNGQWMTVIGSPVLWPTGGYIGPDPCYMIDPNCEAAPAFNLLYVVFILVAALLLTGCAVGVAFVLRRYLFKSEMVRGTNKIMLTPEDLVFVQQKSFTKSVKSMQKSIFFEKPDVVKASEPSQSMSSITEVTDNSDTARFNGDLVHVKEFQFKGFELKGRVMAHLRLLRDLRHENLNPFVGFMNLHVNPSIITEYCSRGSLEDVIHNEDIKLDWDFKLSLLTDLVRGIRYIHSTHLRYHGAIKSRNCVIDSRWVLKLTDFGIPGFLEKSRQTREFQAKDLLWTAPEHLRDPLMAHTGSEKGDVFSFAIITQEIILRTVPYSNTGLSPEELLPKIKKPPPLIRPSVSQQAAPPQYIQIMKQCWAEMPDIRPDVEQIYHQFKMINNGKKMNIVDTMFKMLEKYSNDLEEIVRDRTEQLEEEKKKTDQLLYRMLPRTVAESLKLGERIDAETFTGVTIYFSDIVGFTTISSMSTPLQVVDLLNDLYTMFDATIELYDVYKVETIGDAYMVVSGLPMTNGILHAGEIGTMALDLLSQCGSFVIRHMPQVPLRLRIGLHTGHCVAGVVGLKMPRYCLFGDTVNTASRMESTGSAFRIHISNVTKEMLDELKGYLTEYRGEVELKGKGIHKTFWLIGKEGFSKPLPEPPALGGNNHGIDIPVEYRSTEDGHKKSEPSVLPTQQSLQRVVADVNWTDAPASRKVSELSLVSQNTSLSSKVNRRNSSSRCSSLSSLDSEVEMYNIKNSEHGVANHNQIYETTSYEMIQSPEGSDRTPSPPRRKKFSNEKKKMQMRKSIDDFMENELVIDAQQLSPVLES